jgi:hypothetical protein
MKCICKNKTLEGHEVDCVVFNIKKRRHSTPNTEDWKFKLGDTVKKKSGSQWVGCIVGFYSTVLTPRGYAIESIYHDGSVQIYPENALEKTI